MAPCTASHVVRRSTRGSWECLTSYYDEKTRIRGVSVLPGRDFVPPERRTADEWRTLYSHNIEVRRLDGGDGQVVFSAPALRLMDERYTAGHVCRNVMLSVADAVRAHLIGAAMLASDSSGLHSPPLLEPIDVGPNAVKVFYTGSQDEELIVEILFSEPTRRPPLR